ncbi:ATP-binding protein, partial [Vagococcus salmoninarum]
TEQLLAELPELVIQGRYFPELLEQEQLKVLAQQEDSCHFNLQQQERHFDQVLSEIEEEAGSSKKVTEKNSQQRLGQLFGIGAAVFLLIGLSCLFLKLFLIGGLSVLASFVLLLLKSKGKAQLVPEKVTSLREKEGLLENIAEEIEKIQRELKSLHGQKQAVAETYQFKLEQSVSQWLLELPQRGQLVRVVEELASLKGELSEGQRELNSYRQEFSFMKEWLPIATSSDEELLTALTNFVTEMSQRSLALNQAGQSLTTWQEPLAELAKRRETLTARLYSFLPAGVTHSMDNVQRLLFENQQRSQQAAELAKLSLQVDQLFNDQQDYQLATLVTRKEELKEEIPDLIRKQQEQSGAIEKLRFLIQQQESDGTLRELYQKEANLETELRELINQWYDNRLGDEILQATLDQLAKSQLPDLLRTTTAFFKLLTAERFVEVSYEGDELLLKDQQGLDYAVKELSTGSRDQLYMAIRLGFIQLHSQESLSPVIIDDGWLHYDSQRKQQLFRLLKQLSCDNQIICLSSDSELLAFIEDENEGIIVL